MKVLIDTNVIIDALTFRYNNYKDSVEVIRHVLNGTLTGYISAKQITDIYYILRKYDNNEDSRRDKLATIIDSFEVLPTLKSDLKYCIHSPIKDFEDAVLDEVAKVNMIDYIITNNVKDFEQSKSVIMTPNQLVNLLILM